MWYPIFLIISTALLIGCKSNNYINYYQYSNEANYYFYDSQYDHARNIYEKGFARVPVPLERDLMFYSICLWETGERTRAINILDTNYYTGVALNPSHYFSDMDSTLKNEIIHKNGVFIKRKMDSFNTSKKYKIVDSLDKVDRHVRERLSRALKNPTVDSLRIHQLFDSLSITSLKIYPILDSLFKHEGYLGGVNWFYSRQLYFLLIHSPEWWYEENKQFLYKELKRGHILPIDYARCLDRIKYIGNGNPSYYWQWGYNPERDSLNPDKFFRRQNSIGLSPYFFYSDLTPPKGEMPKCTPFYEIYRQQKDNYNCISK